MLSLCGPLILGNILQQFYNTIDAWIIGRYAGQQQFAAIGIAGTAMNLFLFFIIGLCTGISVVFAQLYGANDIKSFHLEHFQTVFLGTLLTICISIIGILLLTPLLGALGTPATLMPYTREYLVIVLVGLPFSFLYNFYNALLRATGNVRFPLVILASAVLINLIGDLYLVKNLSMGIKGAAIATVCSQGFSVLASILYMLVKCQPLCFQKTDAGFSRRLLLHTLNISIVTGIHQASLYLGKMFVQGAVNSAGTDMISAYTATTRIEGFINSFGDSGAAATSVIVAQSYGARNTSRIRDTVKYSAVLLTIFGILCSAILYITAPAASAFMLGNRSHKALTQAVSYLHLIAIFYIFCFLGNTYTGFFDGIGKTYISFIGAASHITLRAILSWLWIGSKGLDAVALSTGIGWILANILWFVIYKISQAQVYNFMTASRFSPRT